MRNTLKTLAALSALIAGPINPALAQAADQPPANQPPLAKIIAVASENAVSTRQFFGHVVAKETVDLAFQVGGQIVELPVIEGEPVPANGLIAALDQEQFQLALDQAKVQLEQAQRNFERQQKLQGSAVSKAAVEDAQTQVQLLEIAVKNAERSLRDTRLVAPFNALVATRNVANFSTINAGTPIVRLHDMSELRIEIDVPEILFQQAGENPDVDLFAKFPTIDTKFPLEVREFQAETSQVGQTFRITLGMAPPEGHVILPGSSVTVLATLHNEAGAPAIPGSAILTANDGTAQVLVYTAKDETSGSVKLTPIKITPGPRGEVTVTDGLVPGQEIVASGVNLLADGAQVRRFTGFSN